MPVTVLPLQLHFVIHAKENIKCYLKHNGATPVIFIFDSVFHGFNFILDFLGQLGLVLVKVSLILL